MSRLAVPLALLLMAAMPSGSAMAQSPSLPTCNLRSAEANLRAYLAPDFRGCFADAAARILGRFGYQVRQEIDQDKPGAERGIVTGHERQDQLFILHVSAGTGYPAPRPEQPSSQTPPRITAPAPAPVTFSITGSPTTVEGGDLVYRIVRNGNDGRQHRLTLSYSDPNALDNPPDAITFEPSQSAVSLRLRTIVVPGDDGIRTLTVRLMEVSGGGVIGAQRSAQGLVEDSLAPPSYAVRPEGIVNRGEPIHFVVFRDGALAESDIEFSITQGGVPLGTSGGRRLLHFAEGSTARPITVLPRSYDPCGGTVSVTLLGAPGIATSAIAPFSGMIPAECSAASVDDSDTDAFITGPVDDAIFGDDTGDGGWVIPGWLWIPVVLLLAGLIFARRIRRWIDGDDIIEE